MGIPDTQRSFCSTHCGLSTSTPLVPHILELLLTPLPHIHHNNTHFPVTPPCGKVQERGKEGNMEGRHLIQEGFLEEVMPKLSLKG